MALEFANNPLDQRLNSVVTFPVPTPEASFSFWLKMSSFVNSRQRIFGSATNFEVRIENTGIFTNDLFNNTDGASLVSVLALNVWYHIAGTGRLTGAPGNSVTEVFLNGIFEATLTVAGSAVANNTMQIGNRLGIANTQGVNGVIEDLRIYGRLLKAAEILTIYNSRGGDNILHGIVSRTLFDEGKPGSSPSGVGSVKGYAKNAINYTPTGSPIYRESVIASARRRRAS